MAVVVHAGVLLDRRALAGQMPAALAAALAAHVGGSVRAWELAYRRVMDDWASYWSDLDLGGDESLAHWREGRWRVMRAHFRLAGHSAPPLEEMLFYLDTLPREVGRRVEAWQRGALDVLRALAERQRVAVLSPYTASPLLWGMLDAAGAAGAVGAVLGPDELGQAGLGGLAWATVTRLAGSAHGPALLVADGEPIPGARVLQPPADLAQLPDLIQQEEQHDD